MQGRMETEDKLTSQDEHDRCGREGVPPTQVGSCYCDSRETWVDRNFK